MIVLFSDLAEASFVGRPNRFVVTCVLGGVRVRAYLPNPGRLRELFLPGARLFLVPNTGGGKSGLAWTCVAVERDGAPVMLHTHHTNTAVRRLLEKKAIAPFSGCRIVRQEASTGASRFDFLLEDHTGHLYLEVKSCTLFGNAIAMFPDAVTERGRRHLLELARIARSGTRTAVLFCVHTPRVRYFMPDYHTDPAFARTLCDVRSDVAVHAVSLQWDESLRLAEKTRELCIPWRLAEWECDDRGSYIVVLRSPRRRRVTVGALGTISLEIGYYLYVGSAMAGLSQRIARHRALRKGMHWHIDYLRQHTEFVTALPVRSADRLECDIAAALTHIAAGSVARFGSSDCSCPSHLFYFRGDPQTDPAFVRLVQQFRIDRLSPEAASAV